MPPSSVSPTSVSSSSVASTDVTASSATTPIDARPQPAAISGAESTGSVRGGGRVAILGATGSIGTATLDVIRSLRQCDPESDWRAWSISGHSRIDSLSRLAAESAPLPETVVVSDESRRAEADTCWKNLNLQGRCRLDFGPEALVRAATAPEVDTVVASIVGRAGLESTLEAVRAGKRVGLANKETLVVAGPVVTQAAAESGSELLPIDSEHSAIYQCLAESRHLAARSAESVDPRPNPAQSLSSSPADRADSLNSGNSAEDSFSRRFPGVRRLILTASGGPFRDATTQQMRDATPAQALNHPTWDMGQKITIDSATMMNKALEIIEAKWLFDVPADRIEVVIHPQSIIHSLVEFEDGSVIAQLSPPDMRLPIQYALTHPNRLPCPSPVLDRQKPWEMSLLPADHERFPGLSLGFEVAKVGGTAGVVVNGANEIAVPLFLEGKIRFTDIVELCRQTLRSHNHESSPSLSRLLELDAWSREHASGLAAKIHI
ncbi:1-deoxy-D-xylulose 5-phosphate reductoisomerase [Neorhodopirellula lusitana]|uniref:1-deoxy-D-xylulose 5-phosphate reductoisomerase n=1 Tax=Neorhodopirellula lusitana TaxID=445327 RepID=A0ABY1QA26_9BACT|nr:1-deoxy-D-xylulose 5-phosphate reductoisomerase [Neorhodopirellula lusitana]